MGLIVNIIDAIRRIGSSSQRSALKRQDEYLSNKSVLARRIEIVHLDSAPLQTFVATTDPPPETVRPLDASELGAIDGNAAKISTLSQRYLEKSLTEPTPNELDAIFSTWAHSPDRDATTNEEIVQILGAAFGQYCVTALNMRWVLVTDPDGSATAVQGVHTDFRGYPFHSIWKRIRDDEQDFFVPIFATLQKQGAASREVPGVA